MRRGDERRQELGIAECSGVVHGRRPENDLEWEITCNMADLECVITAVGFVSGKHKALIFLLDISPAIVHMKRSIFCSVCYQRIA
jgi:hypothetical protein